VAGAGGREAAKVEEKVPGPIQEADNRPGRNNKYALTWAKPGKWAKGEAKTKA